MGFLSTPLIPEGKVKLAVVDYRIGIDTEKSLKDSGIELIKTVRCKELYEAIDGHPDILLHHLGGSRIVAAPNIYDEIVSVLSKKGFAVTKGSTLLVRNYPGNIAYNVLRIGNIAFHNTKYTDKTIIREYEKLGIPVIHVNQGYTKCSVCVLSEKAAITSDLKISKTLEKYGIECLLIKPGGIFLRNMSYGFIGGASGLLSPKCIAFSGSIEDLEDRHRISEFLHDRGFSITFLSKRKIDDIGSIIPLKYIKI